jgi:hypothetical protein
VCENLLAGPWLIDYLVTRLANNENFIPIAKAFEMIKKAPLHLHPHYFAIILDKYVREI